MCAKKCFDVWVFNLMSLRLTDFAHVSIASYFIPHCSALRFTDGKISSVGDCFVSRLRRPKNVKFGTKVASSMRMMSTLQFLEKVF